MENLSILEITSAAVGITLAILVTGLRRFGPRSWMLATFLLPSSIAALIQGLSEYGVLVSANRAGEASFCLMLIAAVGGFSFISTFTGEKNSPIMRPQRVVCLALSIVAGVLIILLEIKGRLELGGMETPEQILLLGLIGYISSLFLLITSVIVLAKLERILREAEEGLRWEIKFLLLGLAVSFATMIYISSQVLLYAPEFGYLPIRGLALYYPIFLVSCILIAVSWKRSSGRTVAAVSHRLIYSSITLLGVGAYLIASSLLVRNVGDLAFFGIPFGAFFFLLTVLILAILLSGTAFRHRMRNWIRRYLLAGRYDYRQFWLEATEHVQAVNYPNVTAAALADIIHRALGAIDVTVWVRLWNPNRLQLLSKQGNLPDEVGSELREVIEEILNLKAPTSLQDLQNRPEMEVTRRLLENTRASLLVPLISNNRLVGLITVGPDRGGRPYGWESHEFLLVLGGHAAGELHKSDLITTLVAAKEDESFRMFSTFVMHDLKNFASTLSLIAQNATKFQENPEFQKDAFHSIFETAEKMKRLCNSLGSFSSSIAGNKKIEDINRIVRGVVDKNFLGISGKIHLELGQVPLIPLDTEEVERVLQNLVLNAQQAISSDGSIWIRTAARDGVVELIVSDNGKGMSPQFLENELFLPFHTTKSEGLGIGLFQTRKIIGAHQGKIRIKSVEGEGTTVIVEFPAGVYESGKRC